MTRIPTPNQAEHDAALAHHAAEGPFDVLTVAQREGLHEFLLGQDRYLLRDADSADEAELVQLAQEYTATDLRWARQEARRRNIYPLWPSKARDLLAERGVMPVAVDSAGTRAGCELTDGEWEDLAEWAPSGEQRAQWESVMRRLEESLPVAYPRWLQHRARLAACPWDVWVVTQPTVAGAVHCTEYLQVAVLRAMADELGRSDIGVRFVAERRER